MSQAFLDTKKFCYINFQPIGRIAHLSMYWLFHDERNSNFKNLFKEEIFNPTLSNTGHVAQHSRTWFQHWLGAINVPCEGIVGWLWFKVKMTFHNYSLSKWIMPQNPKQNWKEDSKMNTESSNIPKTIKCLIHKIEKSGFSSVRCGRLQGKGKKKVVMLEKWNEIIQLIKATPTISSCCLGPQVQVLHTSTYHAVWETKLTCFMFLLWPNLTIGFLWYPTIFLQFCELRVRGCTVTRACTPYHCACAAPVQVCVFLKFYFCRISSVGQCIVVVTKKTYVLNYAFFTLLHKWVDRRQTHHFEKLQ